MEGFERIDTAELLIRLGRHQEALTASNVAVHDYEVLLRRTPTASDYRIGFGLANMTLSGALDGLKRFAEAEATARRACDELDGLMGTNARNLALHAHYQGLAHLAYGNALHRLGRDSEAERELRRAIEILENAQRSQPDLASLPDELGQAYQSLAEFLRDRGLAEPFLHARWIRRRLTARPP